MGGYKNNLLSGIRQKKEIRDTPILPQGRRERKEGARVNDTS
jgi:hypothetical protein